jgi:hypothetical protein
VDPAYLPGFFFGLGSSRQGLCGFGGILSIRFKISSRAFDSVFFVNLNPRPSCE